ncbi:MAG TPA: BTAD domain-containing putative transcriptional regulator [Kiloniellaceae bacterium]|nr:BTAD domain-containing putative transcriptional regulator [Kiloniellaceae bacterium]
MPQNARTRALIKLLGGFELCTVDGKAVPIAGNKAKGLLAILALSSDMSASRGRLADLLWSDRGDEQARNSLRQLLTALRKSFAEAELDVLETERDQVRLTAAHISIDAVEMARLAREGRAAAASELYGGPLLDGIFLPDRAFETWVSEERRRLEDLAVVAVERVYEAASGERRLAAARRLLALDALRERSHRAVIEALAANGERTQALRQYEACREMLARELGAAPSTETEGLKAAILSGDLPVPPSAASPVPESTEIEVRSEPVVAVLPFVSLSDDRERAFFADGMSGSIISTLAKMPYVRVVAYSSTQIYKDRAVDVRDVGREQDADYVLEGTVRSAGARLRITVQLSECATGRHLWSEKYNGTINDIFALQDEITFKVVLELDVKLREGEQAHFRVGNPSNLEAWELVLEATKTLNGHQRNAWPSAKRVLDRAIALDPDYASAWTMLGWWHWEEAFCGWSKDPKASIVASIAAAERARQLSPTNPEPYLVLAMAHLQRRDFQEAEEYMCEARKLGPNHAMVPAIGANVSMFGGEPEEALRQSQLAIRFCPVYPPWYAGDAAQAHLQLGQLEKASDWARAAIQRDERYIHAHLFLVVAYHELGQLAEARAAAQAALKADPAFSAQAWADAQPFKDPAINRRFLAALLEAGLPA